MTEKQFVIFRLNDLKYGIDILEVNEIVRVQEITKIPNTPVYIEGVINLRGKIIPIADLKKKFALEKTEKTDNTRIIVLQMDDKLIGVIVDEVLEVINISEEKIDTNTELSIEINKSFIKGIARLDNCLAVILNMQNVFLG